ncbi:ribosomal protein L11, putative [Eimeria tenella]|uniref:Ribosomal protein L11, putative n=1 Tax=Eimeria tenella TaxID=5802 RepID=U6KNJ9_EIMTE|nr:ribosomal protein L11, putative [Eimeria tenella]CDJ37028.1 ribosomal protein L11, putative [Eimeria tenella]|eukprot:XP_013227866.1 ribosomal protein L11, putative [Eimeria tenella]
MTNLGRFRLIVPAANAKPSPSIGQTLGPLGINMMAFCKEFNARTAKIRPDVPVQVTIVPNADRTFKFSLRTPSSTWFLLRAARCPMGSEQAGKEVIGNVTLKEGICRSLIGSARAMGIRVTPELLPAFSKRDYTPVENLEQMRRDLRQKRKAARRANAKA